ncbi:HAD hydrolase-like protein [Sphingomonas lycopersici]|uniref:phosphoglycolate phosphatase n=1 Tax=Sphingomonas lycopersici TaxID=2951807 RepID=A0AA42CQJ5_9SPHN|nr:HAD hydrolase-like protein [Sphingomonas lycopersici]MCW6535384.1 HAD hydrolase-like protein [Sphingomonas lycopersici]
MHVFPFTIVGFDLDGTLLDTSADLTAAVNHALAADGREPLAFDDLRSMIGGGGRRMMSLALAATGGYDEALLDRLNAVMIDFYAAHIADHTTPFPGAVAMLDELAARDVKIAMVTNKAEALTRPLLDTLGLTARFTTIIGGAGKPSPLPIETMIAQCGGLDDGGRAAFVGDSHFDVDAAQAAGIPAVACAFGFLTKPVDQLGADAVIDHFDELIPTLETL